jgi:signal transduction histidine kinase
MHKTALASWAHDVRNALGALSLHLEALDQPSDPRTTRILARAGAVLARATAMCNDAMVQEAGDQRDLPRPTFDLMPTIGQVFDLLAPITPAPTSLRLVGRGPIHVMADPRDVFRILFNLIHNAICVARKSASIRRIELSVEETRSTVTVRIADDGPGLPRRVKARLFRREQSSAANGHGLAIARELAERNGAALRLCEAEAGTVFALELRRAAVDLDVLPGMLPATWMEPTRPGASQVAVN